jgi:4-hydroxy-tetrahydrodipicolinate reductase
MGQEVCRAVDADPELRLTAAVDPAFAGRDVSSVAGIDPERGTRIVIAGDAEAFLDAEVDVAVDFTVPTSVLENVRWCVRHAMHVVVGTTGLTQEHLAHIESLIEEEGRESNVFVAPNFAIGAVLMMRFAAEASRVMQRAEIIELHHPAKLDAPSGTAARTAELMEGDVPIHSVRLPGIVADQEVILGDVAQTLSIRHVTTDRTSFMPGVLLAIRGVAELPEPFTVGLEHLLWRS